MVLAAATSYGSAQIFVGSPEEHRDPKAEAKSAKLAEANEALQAQDYPKALKLLTPLAEADPKDAHLLFDLAVAQDQLDQNSPAEASYRQAIADDETYLDPRVGLGLLLARAGRTADAHTELLAAVALKSDDAPLRARAYRALARLDVATAPGPARDELLEALKLTPTTPEDTELSAELAAGATNGQAAAEQAYRKSLAAEPNDPAATAGLAHLLLQAKKATEAEPMLTAALAEHPGDTRLTVQLAAVYAAEGKNDEALPLVEQLHTAHPDEPAVSRMLADLYAGSGDYAKAEPLLATLGGASPQDGVLADDHADALIHLGRFAEAVALLKPIVAQPILFHSPQDLGSAASHLAFASSENHDPVGCLQALVVRGTVLPPSPSSLFLEAISHDRLRQRKEAAEAYKRFLAAANGKFPDQEFQARHRLVALGR
jgi:predicted Zn-dependent protease